MKKDVSYNTRPSKMIDKKSADKFVSAEDQLDILIAESRRNEKKIPWEIVKNQLRKAGKL